MRAWLLAIAFVACLPAAAQERKYALMSLVGDVLLIVHQDIATGSSLDRNVREAVPFPGPALDNLMVFAIEDAVKAHDRSLATVLLAANDRALFNLQARALDDYKHVIDTATGEQTQGFIAPFAYFNLTLVDLAIGAVLGGQVVRESRSASSQQALTAWAALTAEQKTRMLTQLVRFETRRVLPALLRQP